MVTFGPSSLWTPEKSRAFLYLDLSASSLCICLFTAMTLATIIEQGETG